ncbi:NigD1/NigD2 family lipoprotein [Carboxylicivirga marina]|uniref:NigD-like N-terminal domain-containing protein n=1 Tax=Carboxylicivirga marina TaxID=2800988 RepID=A0ABS1HP13_9BACT|nr:NigD-like protein [Carboxylicivirga marina]MBK3519430.1 NigD-like N-terminal domain-containing protein [Carboxylicivirga marina]
MKKFKYGVFLILLGLLIFSCNDDDGYSVGDFWVTTGTIIETGDYFYVVTDGGDALWPSATNVPPSKLEDGMRVLVNYTILGDADDSEIYDYYVKINGTSELLTKPIFNFDETTSEEVKDSIGNDPITILDTWFTDDYLNVEFQYGGGWSIHYVNLVKDTENLTTEEGEIILELKHNKNDDPYNYLQWGIASFDISELKQAGQNSIDLFVRSLDKEGNYQYNKVLAYEYDQVEIEPYSKKFSDTPMTEMVE